jgi:hypothetical protein
MIMNSKGYFLFIFIVMLSIVLTGRSLTAQQPSPSLDETIQFLKDKAEFIYDLGQGNPYSGRIWKLDSISKCTLVWTTEESNKGIPRRDVIRGKGKKTETLPTSVTLSLSDINPQKIGYDSASIAGANGREIRIVSAFYGVYLSTTDSRKVIEWRGGDGDINSSSIILKFKDRQMATRYGKALSHAVNLCGGRLDKKEPF